MRYPRQASCIGNDISVLQSGRKSDKNVDVRPDLPCNVIVIHGVNDVGTSFNAVEDGLCGGLDHRLHGKPGRFVPGSYRMPTAADKNVVEPDPDAVFFKRSIQEATHSPVIPFYWATGKSSTRQGRRTASVSTATATGSTRTCRKAVVPLPTPPAPYRTCGTGASARQWISAAIRFVLSTAHPAACTWCWPPSAWPPWSP